MRTIISGPVTADILADAELFAGIRPSSFVTNGRSTPPASAASPDVFLICKRLGMLGGSARDYTLCQHADACIVAGGNEHLVAVAERYGLALFQG